MRTLDEVRDNEWRHGARFWGEGFMDIEELFRSQARHFAEHSRDIVAVHPEMVREQEVTHGTH